MTKQQMNAALLFASIAGAVACFALGQVEAGMVLLALASGHAIPSPLNRTPAIERTEADQ